MAPSSPPPPSRPRPPPAPGRFRPSAAEPLSFTNERAFPSLGEAVKKKESKKDKKAKASMSLKDFLEGPLKPSKPSDDAILKSLPTAPRPRADDDRPGGMGGAFQDYGGDRGRGAPPPSSPPLPAAFLSVLVTRQFTTHPARRLVPCAWLPARHRPWPYVLPAIVWPLCSFGGQS